MLKGKKILGFKLVSPNNDVQKRGISSQFLDLCINMHKYILPHAADL